jgi:hypothetical protein
MLTKTKIFNLMWVLISFVSLEAAGIEAQLDAEESEVLANHVIFATPGSLACKSVKTTVTARSYELSWRVSNLGNRSVSSWSVELPFAERANIVYASNATVTGSKLIKVRNTPINGRLLPGKSVVFTLVGQHDGSFKKPDCRVPGGGSSSSSSSSSSNSSTSSSSSSSASTSSSTSSTSSSSSTSSGFSSSSSSTSSSSGTGSSSSSSSTSTSTSTSSGLSSSSSSSSSSSGVVLDVHRSLIVHDVATLSGADFSLSRVMNQLAVQFNVLNPWDFINGATLFARMWDAQNPTNSSAAATGVERCTRRLNDFPVQCRPYEGEQSNSPEGYMSSYLPIALVNRFDLHDTEFKHCGEYRLIYAMGSGLGGFVSFEARLSNPTPGFAKGCAEIQNFWANLSGIDSAETRATLLENFYFNGISPDVGPAIYVGNFDEGRGQVRTNQFARGPWILKEYKTGMQNGKSTLYLVTVKSNPYGRFFDVTNTDSRALEFRDDFIDSLPSLLGDLNSIRLNVTLDTHNHGQSVVPEPESLGSGFIQENDYLANFVSGGDSHFAAQIDAQIFLAESSLSVAQLLNRATAMSCAGCHQPSAFGLTKANALGADMSWSNSLGFFHIARSATNGEYPLSPALLQMFLPVRKIELETYLSTFGD